LLRDGHVRLSRKGTVEGVDGIVFHPTQVVADQTASTESIDGGSLRDPDPKAGRVHGG